MTCGINALPRGPSQYRRPRLQHDQEKWKPVFRPVMRQTKILEHDRVSLKRSCSSELTAQMMIPAGEAILQLLRRIGVLALLAATCVLPAMRDARAQSDDRPALLGKFGDWGAYAGTRGGHKVCFAMAQPNSSQTNPPNRPRDPIYLFISTRPADNVRNEVSVIIGYPLKSGSEASADVGSIHFVLQTRGDNAWVKDTGEEARMVDAMRRGSDVVIGGVSGRGTQTTDRYSLKGIAQALDRAAQECR